MISLRKLPTFNSFDQLRDWVSSRGKFRKAIPLGHVYFAPQVDKKDYIEVWYHNTPVVTWYRDRIILNHGGWKTVTTKRRMNTFLPDKHRVWQKDFQWWVTNGHLLNISFDSQTLEIPYVLS